MKASKIIGVGVVVIFIAAFTVIYIIDNLNKAMKKCEKEKTLKFCRANTLALIVIILLIIVAGLVIIIATVAYIMISASGEV